ncbi:SDR family NAD(P)-dependent oxidoreductase [Halopseudomonas pachastrellae]|nr:SDR family NAD(P)-dependent oxidoreductase [Halopseudomonas pachastrellae]
MNLDLSGRRALICGGSQGLGEACARQLAEQGAEVVLLARSLDKLQAVRDSLTTNQGQQHAVLAVDASDRAALTLALVNELERGGPIHIWLNNTGGPAPGRACDASPDAYADALTQHVVNAQAILTLLLPGMRSAGFGASSTCSLPRSKSPFAIWASPIPCGQRLPTGPRPCRLSWRPTALRSTTCCRG